MKDSYVFWFTGLSGSGKTTVACGVKCLLENNGYSVCMIDGDEVRSRFHTHLGFNEADIKENNILIAKLCREKKADFDVILVPIISPLEESRRYVRQLLRDKFFIVYFDAGLETVIKRDVKGLYSKAKEGKINNLIGYSSQGVPYQAPLDADFTIHSGTQDPGESIYRLYGFIISKIRPDKQYLKSRIDNTRKLIKWLSEKPVIFNFLRRLIEFNFISIKNVIKEEFGLNGADKLSYAKFLDVPCGTGEFSVLFHRDNYTGIDISHKYIDFAKKAYQRNFQVKDARDTGFDDSCFDKILILGLFHHLNRDNVNSVLKETKRILRKDGKVLCIEDSPVEDLDFVGKFLQRLDVGDNIRPSEDYEEIFRWFFNIEKSYFLRSGFWKYSVFVLAPKSPGDINE